MKKIFFAAFLTTIISISLSAQNGIDFSGVLETNWALAAPWTDNESYAGRFLAGDIAFSLDELWIDYTDSFWGIRIGRQKIVWGKSDGIDITNVICPSDLSSLSSLIKGDSKLAVDAVCLSLNNNNFSSDSHGATVSLSKNLLHDTIEISFSGILEFDCFDSLLNPSIKYNLSDQITLNAGAIIFLPGPQKEGSYGKYKDLSSFILNARFSF